jgi:hypothetical protein
MTIQHITILGLHSRGSESRVWRSHTSGSVGSCKRDCKRDCKRSRIRTSIHQARVPRHVCGSHINIAPLLLRYCTVLHGAVHARPPYCVRTPINAAEFSARKRCALRVDDPLIVVSQTDERHAGTCFCDLIFQPVDPSAWLAVGAALHLYRARGRRATAAVVRLRYARRRSRFVW